VTKKIVFTPDAKALWKSPKSGVTYPLGWTVSFPDHNLSLHITAEVQNQEMPILGPGAGIWEGLCDVTADVARFTLPAAVSLADVQKYGLSLQKHGVAYMELVGYSSPAVKKQFVSERRARE